MCFWKATIGVNAIADYADREDGLLQGRCKRKNTFESHCRRRHGFAVGLDSDKRFA